MGTATNSTNSASNQHISSSQHCKSTTCSSTHLSNHDAAAAGGCSCLDPTCQRFMAATRSSGGGSAQSPGGDRGSCKSQQQLPTGCYRNYHPNNRYKPLKQTNLQYQRYMKCRDGVGGNNYGGGVGGGSSSSHHHHPHRIMGA